MLRFPLSASSRRADTDANSKTGKFAVMLMPFFGEWPPWFPVYLETCGWNSNIDFQFFTDCTPPRQAPSNVRFEKCDLDIFNRTYLSKYPGHEPIQNSYKICDIRPAFGVLFEEYIAGYQFFGWGDIDVVYGNLSEYLDPIFLDGDVLSFNENHLSGHLLFVRTGCAHRLPSAFPDWFDRVDNVEYCHLDEPRRIGGLRLSARESFNTPLSPHQPWTDGRFVFPLEWYWQSGRLTNDLDGDRTFPYLHFMHWKGGAWPRQCGNAQWESLPRVTNIADNEIPDGFRINARGIFPISTRRGSRG